MNHALILNIAILALIGLVLFLTGNELALLGVAFLRDMPYGLLAQDDDDDDEPTEASGRPMGFVQTDD